VPTSVIPAKAGIQIWLATVMPKDPSLLRCDGDSFYMSDDSYRSVHHSP